MNDFQNTDMRALLSHAAPDPGEEPPVRDVVGPAMAWGDRRRRLDRIMAGAGAALAVVAIGAGVTGLGGGNGSSGGVKAAATGAPTPPSVSGSSASAGCLLTNGHLGSAEFCSLGAELSNFYHDFTQGAFPLLSGKFPAGVTATDDAFYITLSKGGTTEYLYPSITSRSTLDSGQEHCANPHCTLQPLLSGTAALDVRGWATTVDWVAGAGDGPRISVTVTNTPPAVYPLYAGDPEPSASGSSTPPGVLSGAAGSPPSSALNEPVKLMTAQQIADLIAEPGFQQYANEQFAALKDLNQRYQKLLAKEEPNLPRSTVSSSSGSIPAGPDPAQGTTTSSAGSTDPAKAPTTPGSRPVGTPSGIPLGGATSHS